MIDKEFNPTLVQDDDDFQDIDEAEETLSLSDLPRYNDTADWDDFSKDQDRCSSANQEDLFEFFSEGSTASTCPAEKYIIFCGKFISYKEELPEETHKLQNKSKQYPKKRSLLFRWKSSFSKLKTSQSDRGQKADNDYHGSKFLAFQASKKCRISDKIDVSFSKVSITKSWWHSFWFGMLRPLPIEMELNDIRNRQHRRTRSSMMFRSSDDSTGKEVSFAGSRRKGF